MDVATDQDVQTNLQSQIAKYKNDLDPLKTYPIVSFGMAYNFRIRKDSLAVR
jgi:ubiquinone biosynthesis protein Coq4